MKLAVTAASTRIDSSPSRKTSRPLSNTTAPWLMLVVGSVGSETPPVAPWRISTSPSSAPSASSIWVEVKRPILRVLPIC